MDRRDRSSMLYFFKLTEDEKKLIENFRRKRRMEEKEREVERKRKENKAHVERYGRKKHRFVEGLNLISSNPISSKLPNRLFNDRNAGSMTKDELQIDSEENSNVKVMIHDRVHNEKEATRQKNIQDTLKNKLNKQIQKNVLEQKFLDNNVPLQETIIVPDNLTEEQTNKIRKQQKLLETWIGAAIKALKNEIDKVTQIMAKLTNDKIKEIKSYYESQGLAKELTEEKVKKEMKIFIEKGSFYGGNNRMDELGGISPISLKDALIKTSPTTNYLPSNMKAEDDYQLLEVPGKENVWLTSKFGNIALDRLRQSLTKNRKYHLEYFYAGTYVKMENCWTTIGLLNGTIKYLFEIKSGLSDGSTRIVIPKKNEK